MTTLSNKQIERIARKMGMQRYAQAKVQPGMSDVLRYNVNTGVISLFSSMYDSPEDTGQRDNWLRQNLPGGRSYFGYEDEVLAWAEENVSQEFEDIAEAETDEEEDAAWQRLDTKLETIPFGDDLL